MGDTNSTAKFLIFTQQTGESEFEKYRIIQDHRFESDFDKETKAIEQQIAKKRDGGGDE